MVSRGAYVLAVANFRFLKTHFSFNCRRFVTCTPQLLSIVLGDDYEDCLLNMTPYSLKFTDVSEQSDASIMRVDDDEGFRLL